MSPAKALRHRFYRALWVALGVVWPIFSLLLGLMAVLGAMAVLRLITSFTEVSIFALNITTALGLALADLKAQRAAHLAAVAA